MTAAVQPFQEEHLIALLVSTVVSGRVRAITPDPEADSAAAAGQLSSSLSMQLGRLVRRHQDRVRLLDGSALGAFAAEAVQLIEDVVAAPLFSTRLRHELALEAATVWLCFNTMEMRLPIEVERALVVLVTEDRAGALQILTAHLTLQHAPPVMVA